MKAIYIGAGSDVAPITFLSHIKDWVYIDCQPFSEFGIKVHTCDPTYCPKKCIGFKRPTFIPRVRRAMERIGMRYKKISNNELEFTNDNQKVTFFVNTSLPEHIDRVKERIKDFDHWIVMGHDPNCLALKYTTQPITLWGNLNTVYTKDPYEDEYYESFKDQLCFRLNRDEKIKHRFSRFNIIDGLDVFSYDKWANFITYLPRR